MEVNMRILDDGPADAGAHEFAVELEIEGDARMRDLWEKASDKGEHGVPFARVRCEGGKIDPAALRASLERFNETPDDGWRWTVEALAAHLLHELCGIALLDCGYPPSGSAVDAASPPGGRKR